MLLTRTPRLSSRLAARLAATPRSSHAALPAGDLPLETIVPADPHGPGLLNRVAAQELDLIGRGIAALHDGREPEAYVHFKRATELDPRAARAWFLRGKTAETLDEMIACFERAQVLEPRDAQIASNLIWATQRRDAARAQTVARKSAARKPSRPRSASLVYRAGRFALGLDRVAAALAAFAIAGAWVVSALPAELRLKVGELLDAQALDGLMRVAGEGSVGLVRVAGEGPLGSALPFGVGFLALFVGLGVLSGETWTRLWAPLVGFGSAYLWVTAGSTNLAPLLLGACWLVALGGILSGGEWFPRTGLLYRTRRLRPR
jgi:hypothetical protein